jgi:hypothetical protein
MAMNTVNSQAPYKSRLGITLTGLFLAGFLAVVVIGLILDVFASMREGQQASDELAVQQTVVVIDPKLAGELAKAKNFENTQNLADLRDPFLDRAGLSQTEAGRAAVAQNNRTGTGTTGAQPGKTVAGTQPGVKPPGGGGNTTTTVPPETVIVKEDTSVRLAKRDEDIRNNIPVRPINFYLAVEDLLPVGAVSGGSGQDEIMLYSQAADQTFSFPLGTEFFVGWLTGLKPDGPVFIFPASSQTMTKSWVRSIQPLSSSNAAVVNPQVKP